MSGKFAINSVSLLFRVCLQVLLAAPVLCFSQRVLPEYGLRYYYSNHDTNYVSAAGVKKDKKLQGFLQKSGYIFIDSQTFSPETQDGFDTILNVSEKVSSSAFFIYSTEVSNLEYRQFEKEMNAPAYVPDTLVWNKSEISTGTEDPYVHYYYQHKAYGQYPVVGITHWQAVQYCKWQTKRLNAMLQKNGWKNYRVEVALPTEAEWLSAYKQCIFSWLKSPQNKCPHTGPQNYVTHAMGCGQFRCNFGSMRTLRDADIKRSLNSGWNSDGFRLTPVKSYASTFGLYNLCGNVAEWTETSADKNLFNQLEYIYTMGHQIIKNIQTRTDSVKLQQYLYKSADLKSHFAVKGGSWNEELYYMQPRAMQFKPEWYRAENLGFRPVVRVFKN